MSCSILTLAAADILQTDLAACPSMHQGCIFSMMNIGCILIFYLTLYYCYYCKTVIVNNKNKIEATGFSNCMLPFILE